MMVSDGEERRNQHTARKNGKEGNPVEPSSRSLNRCRSQEVFRLKREQQQDKAHGQETCRYHRGTVNASLVDALFHTMPGRVWTASGGGRPAASRTATAIHPAFHHGFDSSPRGLVSDDTGNHNPNEILPYTS